MRIALALLVVILLFSSVALADDGLVLEFNLNEYGGTTAGDNSGHGNTGSVENAVWNGTGKFGSSVIFDGNDDYIVAPDSASLDIVNAITIEFWIKPKDTVVDALIEKGNGGCGNPYEVYMGSQIYFRIRNTTGVCSTLTSTSDLVLNQWNHVITTYNGTKKRIYMNGVLKGEEGFYGPMSTNNEDLFIGITRSLNYDFDGEMDEIRIYNRALSYEEAVAHAACNYTGSGNWDITTSTYCRSKIVMNDANITVDSGGHLVFENVTLIMNATNVDRTRLQVNDGGSLWINDSFLTTGNPTVHWPFVINSNTTVLNSFINYSQWNQTGRGIQFSGVQRPEFALFKNNYIWTDYIRHPGAAIVASNSNNLNFINNTFESKNISVYFSTATEVPTFENNRVISYFGDSPAILLNGTNISSFNSTFTSTSATKGIKLASVPSLFYGSTNQFSTNKIEIVSGAIYSKNHDESGVTRVWGDLNFTPGWPAPGTIALWHFDEGSGSTAEDETPYSNDGTLYNTQWTDGVYGKAIKLPSSSDYVKIFEHESLNSYQTFTFEGYYKFYDLTFRGDIYLYNRARQKKTNGFHIIYLSGGSRICYQLANGTSIINRCSTTFSLETDKWYHFAVTHDDFKKEVKFYKDGQLVGDSKYQTDALPVDDGDAYFGGYQGGNRFRGEIDEARISRRVLQPGEFLPRMHDETIVANANISFIQGVNFTADNVTLIMNQSSDGEHLLEVGGYSYVRFLNSNITIAPNLYYYYFGSRDYSKLFVHNSNIYGHRNSWSGRVLDNFLGMVDFRNTTIKARRYTGFFINYADAPSVLENVTILKPDLSITAFMSTTLDENIYIHNINVTGRINAYRNTLTIIDSAVEDIRHSSAKVVTVNLINTTKSGTTLFDGSVYSEILHKWYFSALVQDSEGVAVSWADVELIDQYGKTRHFGQTDVTGITRWNVTQYNETNVSFGGTTYYNPYTLKANKTGVGNNTIELTINRSRNTGIVLNNTQYGYGVIGTPTTQGVSDLRIMVDGVESRGPYTGIHTVKIMDGGIILVELQHDFDNTNVDIGEWTIRRGENWTGINDNALPVTLHVPMIGTYCNVIQCPGITDLDETCVGGWQTVDSTLAGATCKVDVTGTVIQDDDDTMGTASVISAPGFDMPLIAILFTLALLVFLRKK